MKVLDLARELKQKPKDFIKFLTEVSIKVKTPNTKLDDETVQIIRELFEEKKLGKTPSKKNESGSNNGAEKNAKCIEILTETIIVKDFAAMIGINLSEIMKVLLQKGFLLNLNSEIDKNTAVEVAKILGVSVITSQNEKCSGDEQIRAHMEKIEEQDLELNENDLVLRPPVITIMGHVDHGKTLLLDTIRKTNVVEGEAGGITQHIGAYQVEVKEKRLTFLDTPGHEAFTTLRARGAQVTDIAILVLAADEGIKPQTIEAINHAKAANVPIIVALNKMDKPGANLDRCKQMLSEYELVAEDWGGSTTMVPISAKTGDGINELLDMIILTADLQELKADPIRPAQGIIIESRLSRKKGPTATVLIKSGTLKVGDNFVIGSIAGKVRALLNDQGQPLKEVGPGSPAEIMGISEVPRPGELLEVVASEKESRSIIEKRALTQSEYSQKVVKQISFENLSKQINEGELRKLNLIIKADVNGSLEGVVASLSQIPNEEIGINVIHSATGPVTENDIMLARASEALVIAFGVSVNSDAQKIAEEEGIQIKTYKIIYDIVEDVKNVLEGMFTIEYENVELGKAEVRALFKFSKVGIIAGCMVLSGKMLRNSKAYVIREKETIFEGKLNSLKRFKEDVKEVEKGYECGIVMDGFTTLQEGDIIQAFEVKEKNRL